MINQRHPKGCLFISEVTGIFNLQLFMYNEAVRIYYKNFVWGGRVCGKIKKIMK